MNSTSYTFDLDGDMLDVRCEGAFCEKSSELEAAIGKLFPKASKVRESTTTEKESEDDDMEEMMGKGKAVMSMGCGSMKKGIRNMACGSIKPKK